MPHTGLVFDGGHLNTCTVDHLLDKQLTGERLVNRAVFQHGRSAAVQTSESSTVGPLHLPKAPRTVNGHVDHKHKRTKAARPKEVWAEPSEFSGVGNDSAAGVEADELLLGGASVSGATTSGAGNLCCNAERVLPHPSSSAPRKNPNRKKKFSHKKRDDIPSPGSSAPPPMTHQQQEDWEQEIQEVACTNWGTMHFGLTAYEPEDVIHLALQDLTLQHRTKEDPSAPTSYVPAVHHAWPVHWRIYRAPTEPDQFVNADE